MLLVCTLFPFPFIHSTVEKQLLNHQNPQKGQSGSCGANCVLCRDDSACSADSKCFYLVDNELCAVKKSCAADCKVCRTQSECETEGAGGNNICVWSSIFTQCSGTTCHTNCEECDPFSPPENTECETSRAPPNGCLVDPLSEGCSANSASPTAVPTMDPTPEPSIAVPTPEPTSSPSPSPTTSPDVSPDTLECDSFSGIGDVGRGDIKRYDLSIPFVASRVVISLCNDVTNFATRMELQERDGTVIAADEAGCNFANRLASLIDITGSFSNQNYVVTIAGINDSESGSVLVQVSCFTEAPTVSPTNGPSREPTRKPTKKPTKKPTRKPTRKPTKRPTKRPTRRPTRWWCP